MITDKNRKTTVSSPPKIVSNNPETLTDGILEPGVLAARYLG